MYNRFLACAFIKEYSSFEKRDRQNKAMPIHFAIENRIYNMF